ncbi:MAG TPA: alpha/beta hydrolase [Anaeromyxobacteraceae bacterium]|nr:alpha/beta hydrolase [Anaeromyxobacteraceae bacterium]
MPVLALPSGAVAYAERGAPDAPPLVLLHANPGDRRDWDEVAPALSARFRVLAVDWPGFGEAPPPAAPAASSAMGLAALLRELVEAVDLPPAVLIGHSVGGYAATRLALDAPARVRALVLVDPGGFTPPSWLGRTFCRVKGREWVTRRIAGRFAARYLRTRTPAARAIIERARTEQRDPARVAIDAAIWRSFNHPEHDLRARAAAITVPTLLVWGRHDPVVRPRVDGAAARAALPHAAYVEIDTGHCPFAEAPAMFLGAVQPFLASLDGGSPGPGRSSSP